MNNSTYLSYTLFFGLFFSLQLSLKGQTGLVEITPLNKYEFEIRNVSSYPIEVHIDDSMSFRLLPKAWKGMDQKEIGKTSVMQLKYTQRDAVTVNNDIIRQMTEYSGLNWAKDVVNEFWGRLLKGEEVRLREIADSSLENMVLDADAELELELLEEDIRVNAALFAASNGVQNRFSGNFQPILMHPFTVSKKALTPLVNVIWDFPLKKQSLGDFWDRKSSNTTSEFQLSVGLKPELRWGKSHTFSSLHGFIATYRPAYSLLPEDDFFFVGDSYLENTPNEVEELLTGEHINLNINHFSGGVFVRTFFYPEFFFDIGGGYNFAHSTRLHFDSTDENGDAIFHLPEGLEFKREKTKDIANVEMNRWYGLLRFGLHISKTYHKEPTKGFYIVGSLRTVYEPTVTANEEYEFYYESDNELFFVPLSDDSIERDKMQLMWELGIGLGL